MADSSKELEESVSRSGNFKVATLVVQAVSIVLIDWTEANQTILHYSTNLSINKKVYKIFQKNILCNEGIKHFVSVVCGVFYMF